MHILLRFLPFYLVLLTGCFELREEVDLRADGSGRFTFTLNMSESKSNLATYMRLGTFNGKEVPTREDIAEEVAFLKKTLAACKGISEVRTFSNFEDFIFSIGGQFDNVQNLNAAMDRISAAMNRDSEPAGQFRSFGYSPNVFRRYFDYPVELMDYSELTTLQRYMLEQARVVSIYRFQQSIRDFSNPEAEIAPNRRAIKLEVTVGSLMKGGGTMANSIAF
ncbi:MAG: hypothetical protein IPL49_09495 [Saprospirales bacterium]|nr:hypothetical protein [Saprospirales bacterium]MBK8491103.1 hypothetical protein [Saprospirales bacterium]